MPFGKQFNNGCTFTGELSVPTFEDGVCDGDLNRAVTVDSDGQLNITFKMDGDNEGEDTDIGILSADAELANFPISEFGAGDEQFELRGLVVATRKETTFTPTILDGSTFNFVEIFNILQGGNIPGIILELIVGSVDFNSGDSMDVEAVATEFRSFFGCQQNVDSAVNYDTGNIEPLRSRGEISVRN